jgi:hypothetical protein
VREKGDRFIFSCVDDRDRATQHAFPAGAASVFQFIDITSLSARYSLHQQAQVFRVITRIDNQMNMICHQAVGMYLALKFCFPLLKSVEIIEKVIVSGKHSLSVMPTLDDMMWTVWQDYTGMSRHIKGLLCVDVSVKK